MTNDEAADKAKDRIVEMQSRIFDKAAAYTNLILIAGYASAFAIWNLTKALLSPKTTIAVALFLGLSLVCFIFFEVYKMVMNANYYSKFSVIMKDVNSPHDFLQKYKIFETNIHRNSVGFKKVWVFSLWFCIITALISLGILFYNFIVFLLPVWPSS